VRFLRRLAVLRSNAKLDGGRFAEVRNQSRRANPVHLASQPPEARAHGLRKGKHRNSGAAPLSKTTVGKILRRQLREQEITNP
jgi:hypothetical protein